MMILCKQIMHIMHNFVLIFVIQTIATVSWAASHRRLKRVVNGELLLDRDSGYASTLYFVWIGYGRKSTADDWDWDNELCGGALLTPTVVQSACHCFVSWHSRRLNGAEWHYKNTNTMEAVIGCNQWEPRKCSPVEISKYYMNPLCRKMWGWTCNDYAVLVLSSAVKLTNDIRTAPLLTIEELVETWRRTLSRRAVCMIMGYGRYISLNDKTKSKFLRHGWEAVQPYIDCYEDYSFQSTSVERVNITSYMQFATWTCLKPFGKELGTGLEDLVGKGDSGSPITCDNTYFGLVSQTGETFTSFHANTNDLVYYAYANSRFYRLTFNYEMANPDVDLPTKYHTIPPSVLMHPDEAPPNF